MQDYIINCLKGVNEVTFGISSEEITNRLGRAESGNWIVI